MVVQYHGVRYITADTGSPRIFGKHHEYALAGIHVRRFGEFAQVARDKWVTRKRSGPGDIGRRYCAGK